MINENKGKLINYIKDVLIENNPNKDNFGDIYEYNIIDMFYSFRKLNLNGANFLDLLENNKYCILGWYYRENDNGIITLSEILKNQEERQKYLDDLLSNAQINNKYVLDTFILTYL